MKLLLVGASGLVGSHVLDKALVLPEVETIFAPTRRQLPVHPKLHAPRVSYEDLPSEATWWQVDAVICTLGTTMRTAGSKSAFRRVDHDYPLAVAHLALRQQTPTYVLNSAIGANASSRFFYNRVKGELEDDLTALGFRSLTFVRPGVIGGERREFRLGERTLASGLTLMGPLLPKRWRINPASRIADALLTSAIEATEGVHVVDSEQLI